MTWPVVLLSYMLTQTFRQYMESFRTKFAELDLNGDGSVVSFWVVVLVDK